VISTAIAAHEYRRITPNEIYQQLSVEIVDAHGISHAIRAGHAVGAGEIGFTSQLGRNKSRLRDLMTSWTKMPQ
jgi:hypothetical protein